MHGLALTRVPLLVPMLVPVPVPTLAVVLVICPQRGYRCDRPTRCGQSWRLLPWTRTAPVRALRRQSPVRARDARPRRLWLPGAVRWDGDKPQLAVQTPATATAVRTAAPGVTPVASWPPCGHAHKPCVLAAVRMHRHLRCPCPCWMRGGGAHPHNLPVTVVQAADVDGRVAKLLQRLARQDGVAVPLHRRGPQLFALGPRPPVEVVVVQNRLHGAWCLCLCQCLCQCLCGRACVCVASVSAWLGTCGVCPHTHTPPPVCPV